MRALTFRMCTVSAFSPLPYSCLWLRDRYNAAPNLRSHAGLNAIGWCHLTNSPTLTTCIHINRFVNNLCCEPQRAAFVTYFLLFVSRSTGAVTDLPARCWTYQRRLLFNATFPVAAGRDMLFLLRGQFSFATPPALTLWTLCLSRRCLDNRFSRDLFSASPLRMLPYCRERRLPPTTIAFALPPFSATYRLSPFTVLTN